MAESKIPPGLAFDRAGWPSRRPSLDEAKILAEVRSQVATAVGLDAQYLDSQSILDRYDELLSERLTHTEPRPVQLITSVQSEQMMLSF